MKKFFSLFVSLLTLACYSQTITYTESTENIANPERGFYYHTETHSGNYELLDQNALTTRRLQRGETLILRVFYLEDFRTAQISSSYIANMQTDFNRCRNAGYKMWIRFAYNDGDTPGNDDADIFNVLNHIQQLQGVIAANQDVIAGFQEGFIGRWGEGYYTNFYGNNGVLTSTNVSQRNQILQAVYNNFASYANKIVEVRTPKFKQMFTGSTVANTSPYTPGNVGSFIGYHNDAAMSGGSSESGTFQSNAEKLFMQAESKYTAIGGEADTYPTPDTDCINAINYLDKYSYCYFNSAGYVSGLVAEWSADGCFTEIQKKLGYRLVVISSQVSSNNLNITIKNTGFGHIYNQRNVYLVYRNVATGGETSFLLNTDARLWLKGSNILLTQMIPSLPDGEYDVFLHLPDNSTPSPTYAIRFANNGMWEAIKGYNNLNIRLHPVALGINAVVYNNHIDINSINYKVEIFDMTGKKVSESTDLSNLSIGVYIVKIKTSDNLYTIKVRKE